MNYDDALDHEMTIKDIVSELKKQGIAYRIEGDTVWADDVVAEAGKAVVVGAVAFRAGDRGEALLGWLGY